MYTLELTENQLKNVKFSILLAIKSQNTDETATLVLSALLSEINRQFTAQTDPDEDE